MYPFPGLPNDLTREIAKVSPGVYRNLSLTSKDINKIIKQPSVLENICRAPITPAELTRYFVQKINSNRNYSFGLKTRLTRDPLIHYRLLSVAKYSDHYL